MAHRDRSQGFAFVYVDLKKLLAEGANLDPVHPVGQGVPVEQAINFNKDPDKRAVARVARDLDPEEFTPIQPSPEPASESSSESTDPVHQRMHAIQQIKRNLDRLQSLHHRLHTMLEDLEKVSQWRSKKRREEE